RPFSGRNTMTTAQTVIGHLLLVGPPGWREQSNVASGGCRHNPWGLVPGPNVRLPARTPHGEVRSCEPGGAGATLFVRLSRKWRPGREVRRGRRRDAGTRRRPFFGCYPGGCRARSSVGERLLHTQE